MKIELPVSSPLVCTPFFIYFKYKEHTHLYVFTKTSNLLGYILADSILYEFPPSLTAILVAKFYEVEGTIL